MKFIYLISFLVIVIISSSLFPSVREFFDDPPPVDTTTTTTTVPPPRLDDQVAPALEKTITPTATQTAITNGTTPPTPSALGAS